MALLTAGYLLLRLPLLDNALWHDEIYRTFLYLDSHPFQDLSSYDSKFEWGKDWKRQIAIHPPFLLSFYFFAIRLLGDSERVVHLFPLIAGLAGILLFYLSASALFDEEIGIMAAAGLVVCNSSISYSVQAVYAIFDLFIFSLSLFLFIQFIKKKSRAYLICLLITQFVGLLFYYHFLVVLACQTSLLFFFRDRLNLSLKKIVLPVVCGFAVIFFLGFNAMSHSSEHYKYDTWIRSDLFQVFKTMQGLPWYVRK